ncbi:MAG: hypothetical protein R3F39_13600 [Myxococcota bacterium]
MLALTWLSTTAARADAPELPRRAVGFSAGLLVGGYGRFKSLDSGFGGCSIPCEGGATTRYTERARAGMGLHSLFRSGQHLQLGLSLWVMSAWQPQLRGQPSLDLGARFDVGFGFEYIRPVGRAALVLGPQIGLGLGGGDGVAAVGLQLMLNVGLQVPLELVMLRATVGYQQDVLLLNDIEGLATLTAIGGRAVLTLGFYFGT